MEFSKAFGTNPTARLMKTLQDIVVPKQLEWGIYTLDDSIRGRDPKQDAKLGEEILGQKDILSALIHTYSVVHQWDSRLCQQVRVS